MDLKFKENELFEKIKKSFFLLEPMDSLLVDLICLNVDFSQERLLMNTIHHASIKKYPNKIDYTTRYLKMLIGLLEYNGIEVLDTLYNEYICFLNTNMEDKEYYYRHFLLDEHIVIIKSTYNMISRGTTGLCVWEGARVLAEWCLQNKQYLKNKTVLELGCGVGLSGITAIINCKCKKYIFSDCNEEVLDILKHNVQLNIEENEKAKMNNNDPCDLSSEISDMRIETMNEVKESCGDIDKPHILNEPNDIGRFQNTSILAKSLTFEEVSVLESSNILCDVVLASDVVYDSDLFPSLKNALVNIFKSNNDCMAIFACKVRNMDTFELFLDVLKETNLFVISQEKLNSDKLFFFTDQKMYSMVKIIVIKSKATV